MRPQCLDQATILDSLLSLSSRNLSAIVLISELADDELFGVRLDPKILYPQDSVFRIPDNNLNLNLTILVT